jgi:hypothetical protein
MMVLGIAFTDSGDIVTDEFGRPLITDMKLLVDVVGNLKALFPSERYRVFELKLSEVL